MPFLITEKGGALLPHLFTLTFIKGGFFSVALSLESPRLDVIQHFVSVKSGLSSVLVQYSDDLIVFS
jgi:hypothetical protein